MTASMTTISMASYMMACMTTFDVIYLDKYDDNKYDGMYDDIMMHDDMYDVMNDGMYGIYGGKYG